MRIDDVTHAPRLRAALLGAAAAIALAASAGCPTSANAEDGCTSDIDCGEFRRCDTGNGTCRCTADEACDAAEFCNLGGSCQKKTECLTDEDCRTPENPNGICDTRAADPAANDDFFGATGGQCITLSAQLQCLMDSHCPFGFHCQANTCLPGCVDNGDCPLGQPCINGACNATPGACNEVGYCEFGETCGATNTCAPHREASFLCDRCDPADLLGNPCPDSCLIDTSVEPTPCSVDGDCARGLCQARQCLTDADCGGGGTCEGGGLFTPGECSNRECGDYFCGSTTCSDTDPCPRGYDCNVLIIVDPNSQCTPGSGSAQCGAPRVCLGGGENEEQGFCSCSSDAACPVDPFRPATCSNPGPNGVCIIGAVCAPQAGLLCEDVL